jgi:hypothetical protein
MGIQADNSLVLAVLRISVLLLSLVLFETGSILSAAFQDPISYLK